MTLERIMVTVNSAAMSGFVFLLTGERHPPQIIVGDDVRLRPVGEPGGVRGPGQHVLHLQPQGQGRQRQSHARAGGAHRLVGTKVVFLFCCVCQVLFE